MAFDILIHSGVVIDGTGGARYEADVGVSDGKIEAIGRLGHAVATETIDASGHVVAPGFIDMHSHSDVTLLDDPGGESKAYQGVTTEVTGNCSLSPFPAGKGGPKVLREALGKSLISKVEWTWTTLDEWAQAMESNGISINVAPQLGHAALQVAAGATEDQRATQDEMRTMHHLAAEAMEQGAFSLSTGLNLAPSAYASTDEVVALCQTVARYEGAFYVTHARGGPGSQISQIVEAVEIGQRAEIPVQFSHLAIVDRRFHGRGSEMLAIFDKAHEEGLDITYDMYPYTAAGAGLNQTIPLWAQSGTLNDYMARLAEPDTRARIRDDMNVGIGGLPPLWDKWIVQFVHTDRNRDVLGRSIQNIAEERGVEPAEAALQLVEEEGGTVPTLVHNRIEGDVREFMVHELAMFGSDGRAISPDGLYARQMPHPRFYGTYPRVLGRYVRKEPAALSLEAAIYKMTGFPVQRLSLRDRGLVKQGLIADLVVFDPDTIIDTATFTDPHQFPKGLPYVLVAGVTVIDGAMHTGARPGRVLRRGG